MTEAKWLTCDNFDRFWTFFTTAQDADRRWRLFACACCRLIPEFMVSAPDVECLRLAEVEADGLRGPGGVEYPTDDEWDIRWYRRNNQSIAHRAATAYRDFVWKSECSARKSSVEWAEVRALADQPLSELFRDIFGNPFRLVAVDPLWLTSTAVSLAEGIYQDRTFDRLPILADALQDAGCGNEDILNHCRQSGEHVRGCWVIDLLTGRK